MRLTLSIQLLALKSLNPNVLTEDHQQKHFKQNFPYPWDSPVKSKEADAHEILKIKYVWFSLSNKNTQKM